MLAIRRILHPTDFSECAQLAFEFACVLAQRYGADLHVLHVASHPVVAPVEGMPGHYREELSARLSVMRAKERDVRVESQLLFSNAPATEISRVARDIKADLVVMGTHGRTGLRRLLLGSVAAHVMQRAPCPVVTVTAPLAEENSTTERALESTCGDAASTSSRQ